MRLSRIALQFLSIAALCSLFAFPANADEHRVYFSFGGDKRLPDCSAGSVQNAAAGSIGRAYPDYHNGLKVLDIDRVQETSYKVNGVSPLARRYCQGKASLSDGSLQSIYFMIEEHAGFVGLGWNVEACLEPRDKWRVYGRYCSTVRPR